MGRILAIDYGKVRVGVAVSDPLKIIATALETVETKRFMDFLKDYVSKNEVELFVVGMPRQMNNKPSESYSYIKPFVDNLAKTFPDIKIEMIDERFTSKMAQRTIIDAGIKKMDRRDKSLTDKVSATIILQTYLHKQELSNI